MKLQNGESKCDRCNGKKTISAKDAGHFIFREGQKVICPRCQGTGKLDWVEKICGKRIDEKLSYSDLDIYSMYPASIISKET